MEMKHIPFKPSPYFNATITKSTEGDGEEVAPNLVQPKDKIRDEQEDRHEFITAMTQEMEAHESRNNWSLVLEHIYLLVQESIRNLVLQDKKFLEDRVQKYKAIIYEHEGIQTGASKFNVCVVVLCPIR